MTVILSILVFLFTLFVLMPANALNIEPGTWMLVLLGIIVLKPVITAMKEGYAMAREEKAKKDAEDRIKAELSGTEPAKVEEVKPAEDGEPRTKTGLPRTKDEIEKFDHKFWRGLTAFVIGGIVLIFLMSL